MEIGTGLTAFALVKLLGPSFEYVGDRLKNTTARAIGNLGRIVDAAVRKLGSRLEGAGAVHPRVVQRLLAEGAFCEDVLATEYLGGVLASARTENSRDDRAAALCALVGRLTSYQLRAHYVFYRALKRLVDKLDRPFESKVKSPTFGVTFVTGEFMAAMEFAGNEVPDDLLVHALLGLTRESLVEWPVGGGPASLGAIHRADAAQATQEFVMFPTSQGIELFLAAHGHLEVGVRGFFDSKVSMDFEAVIPATPSARLKR